LLPIDETIPIPVTTTRLITSLDHFLRWEADRAPTKPRPGSAD